MMIESVAQIGAPKGSPILQEATWMATRAIAPDSADAHGYALRAMVIWLREQWDRYPEDCELSGVDHRVFHRKAVCRRH